MLRGSLLVLLVACGGSNPKPSYRWASEDELAPKLVPSVAAQTWYRAASICGQGPYEVEVPLADAKWGEEVALQLATPRRIAITAVLYGDEEELRKASATFDRDGHASGKPDNVRCVADAKERLAAVRSGGGGTVVPDVPIGTTIVTQPPVPSTPAPLVVEDGIDPESAVEIVRFAWREHTRRVKRVRIRFWSIEPNDLDGVRFGVMRFEWRPSVPEAEYEAYLVARAQRDESERLRREAEWRREQQTTRDQRIVVTTIDPAAEARRRAAQLEDDRRRARDAAAALERRRRREAYCATHPDSRDCWGAGGRKRFLELEARARERDAYCAAHREDLRCWSADERARRASAWRARITAAAAPPKQPDGPPPTPRDETPPPKLSEHAEWRPGYWLWTNATWVWLSGMWRVPDEDIAQERTTTAPVAPPPPRTEDIPPPPATTTIWVSGFWQWNGTSYIWVPGSYQVRPEADMRWRPTEWRPRGSVHVLVPGGWIRIRGGRR